MYCGTSPNVIVLAGEPGPVLESVRRSTSGSPEKVFSNFFSQDSRMFLGDQAWIQSQERHEGSPSSRPWPCCSIVRAAAISLFFSRS